MCCRVVSSFRLAHDQQKLGFPAKFKEYKVQNVVGSCDVGVREIRDLERDLKRYFDI